MSAQTDLKARAKSFIVENLNKIRNTMGVDTAQILNVMNDAGYKVSSTSVRRYLSELIEEGTILKEGKLYSAPRIDHVEEEVAEEVAEPVVEEEVAEEVTEENIKEVDDGKIVETSLKIASDIIRSGKTATFNVEYTNGKTRSFACNNMDRLEGVVSKVIPDESLVQKVEVFEATAATIPQSSTPETKPVEKKEEKKKPEVQEKKKKEPAKTTKAAPKPPKASKYTRAHALADVLKQVKLTDKRMTKADLIMHSNNQYIGHGGKDNLKEAKWYFNNVIGILELMGTIKVDGEVVEVA